MFSLKNFALGKMVEKQQRSLLSQLYSECSAEKQKAIAKDVFYWMQVLGNEIVKIGDNNTALTNLCQNKVLEATARRQETLKLGASDFTNPTWAIAALIESQAIAVSAYCQKRMSKKRYENIREACLNWIQATLSDTEAEEVRTKAKGLK